MACKIDLRDIIVAEANAQGVPPEIALAVAAKETKICHWRANGSVIRGLDGEYGVMQLMPATAAGLGVDDPADVNQNIYGGVKYLRQLYDHYGDWQLAVQHYNGSGPKAQAYAVAVMAIARGYGFALNASTSSPAAVGKSDAIGAIRSWLTPQIGGLFVAGAVLVWAIVSD